MATFYEEKQPFTIFIISMLSTLIFIIIFNYLNLEKISFTLYYLILSLIAVLLLNFHALRIRITDENLEFGFGLIRNKIDRKDIISCEKMDIKFSNYLGAGIRYGFDGTIAYNTKFSGKAVKIKAKEKNREYVITTDNPERICSLLK